MRLLLREKSRICSKRKLFEETLSFKMTLRMRLFNVFK